MVKENNKSFVLNNPDKKKVDKIKVDGCLIGSKKHKCDWLLVIKEPTNKAFFIELKGCDLHHALVQLESTLNETHKKFGAFDRRCYAVTARVPRYGPKIQKLALQFYKKNKVTLSVRNKKFVESI